MKKILFFGVVYSFLLSACHKDIEPCSPRCIKNEIAANKNDKNWLIGAVDEYTFQGKTVYAFEPDGSIIADASTSIKDGSCNTICNVGGLVAQV